MGVSEPLRVSRRVFRRRSGSPRRSQRPLPGHVGVRASPAGPCRFQGLGTCPSSRSAVPLDLSPRPRRRGRPWRLIHSGLLRSRLLLLRNGGRRGAPARQRRTPDGRPADERGAAVRDQDLPRPGPALVVDVLDLNSCAGLLGNSCARPGGFAVVAPPRPARGWHQLLDVLAAQQGAGVRGGYRAQPGPDQGSSISQMSESSTSRSTLNTRPSRLSDR